MDWKRESIEKLKGYEARRQAVKSVEAELAMLEDDFVSLQSTATDGIRVTGSGGDKESARLSNIARRGELARVLKQTKLQVTMVECALVMLSDDARRVLELFFIKPCEGYVEKLCGELNISKTEVYRIKDRGLYRFTLALYGATES
ncbi:MAG: hypothetical protein FWE08_06100 [Oscillospiraceae bacterium]|nr:hypothetical protein [Oscillospiraceae bacterium]